MRFLLYAFLLQSCFFCSLVIGQTATFELIPGATTANDMSPDGRYVVGNTFDGAYLFDTDTNTMTILPAPALDAVAVSDDGSVVLGNIPDPTGVGTQVAARWTQDSGWESLGFLPNAGACPSRSSAYELSADGETAIGLSWDGCSGRGFVWTQSSGMVELESLANGNNRASVLSADGSLIGGFAQGSFSRTPCIWGSDSVGQLLDPPNGDALGEIHGMNDAGTVMLGSWLGEDEPDVPATRAHRWTWIDGSWERELIGEGSLISGWAGIPMDIANDDTVVGFDILLTSRRAWIQYQGQGPLVLLKAWANSNGAGIPAEQQLQVCQAISTNGRILCGHGAFTGAWIIRVTPDEILGDVNGDGLVNLLDVQPFIQLVASGEYQFAADINGDGAVNLLDVDPFIDLLGS